MADNDSNIIKPVGSLQNITHLTPARRREQGKRRDDWHEEESEESEQEVNESIEEEDLDDVLVENEEDQNIIDYCA